MKIFFPRISLNDYPLFDYAPYETALASKLVDVAINEKLDIFMCITPFHMPRQRIWHVKFYYKGISVPVITTLHGTDIT